MKKLIYIFIILLLNSCDFDIAGISDSEAELPEITTTGEDTFGCKINGSVFVPKFSSFMTDIALYSSMYKNTIEITAFNQDLIKENDGCSNSKVRLNFQLDSNKNITNKATLEFIYCGKPSESDSEYTPYKHYQSIILNDDDEYNKFEILRYDTTNIRKIKFAGTFQGKLYSQNGDEIKITKGRFDVLID